MMPGTEVRFPKIEVELSGEDGNAYAIMGRVRRKLRRGGVTEEEQIEFMEEARAGDYDHLLQTVMRWVIVH